MLTFFRKIIRCFRQINFYFIFYTNTSLVVGNKHDSNKRWESHAPPSGIRKSVTFESLSRKATQVCVCRDTRPNNRTNILDRHSRDRRGYRETGTKFVVFEHRVSFFFIILFDYGKMERDPWTIILHKIGRKLYCFNQKHSNIYNFNKTPFG